MIVTGHRHHQSERRTTVWIAIIGSPVIAALIAAVVAWAPWKSSEITPRETLPPGVSFPDSPAGEMSVYVNPTSGAGNATVTLSGEGFPGNARVTIRFHTEQFAETRTNGQGKFANVTAKIPRSFKPFAPQQFDIVAVSGAFSARTPFQLTG
jgi:hypothetical protein